MSKPDPARSFIVTREGEQPDPAKALPFSKAAAAFLKQIGTDPALRLHDALTGISYSPADADAVRAVYFSELRPDALEVKSADGRLVKRVENLPETLRELARQKSGGLFVPADDLWLVSPPEVNPEFDEQIELLQQELTPVKDKVPFENEMRAPVKTPAENYPVEVQEDLDALPGLSGEKMLNATIAFARQASPATLAVLGALAGMVAYKSMGLKGAVGLLLAVAALKRYLKMGSRIIMDQRLDLVARGIQAGIPVNPDGQVDGEFLDALRHLPAGDHNLAFRQISPTIRGRPWERHPIKVEADKYALESYSETVAQVVDGDTFVGQRGRYRLIGIDAPELDHQGQSQPGAAKAWETLREMIPPGAQVRVEVARNQPALYGRMPCYLYTKDPVSGQEQCVNQLLVASGLARPTNFQPYHPKMPEFLQAALEAIAQRKGLWSSFFNPVPTPKLFAVRAEKSPTGDGSERIDFSLA